ncbi:MAG: DNA repair protein RecO [Pseudomonadota bacterium]|nr:DNA repair protein RecO [Pseudomonadota bacterium]
MQVETEAIVCALRGHGEHGGIVRIFTPRDGLVAAYVRGARSRRMRPVLMAGNVVAAQLRSRSDAQLPQATIELAQSRAAVLGEPLPAAAVDWAAALVATTLPERQPYPRLYQAFAGLLDAVEAAPSAKGWAPALVHFELLLLKELGFGLDLDSCALTGSADDLVAVSPRSGRAISASAAEPYDGKLLKLPRFVFDGGAASWADVLAGLELSGHFLVRDVLPERARPVGEIRARLVERLKRAAD